MSEKRPSDNEPQAVQQIIITFRGPEGLEMEIRSTSVHPVQLNMAALGLLRASLDAFAGEPGPGAPGGSGILVPRIGLRPGGKL